MTRPFRLKKGDLSVTMNLFTGPIEYSDLTEADTFLLIDGCDFPLDLSQVPRWLRCLSLRKCGGLTDLHGLGDKLEFLDIDECHELVSLAGLPAQLRSLSLQDNKALKWQPELLPREIDTLYLLRLHDVTDLRGLPPELNELSIQSLSALHSFEGLANSVERVDLYLWRQAFDLNALPAEIIDFAIDGSGAIGPLPFRPSLRDLSLGRFSSVQVSTPDGLDVIPGVTVNDIDEYRALIKQYRQHLRNRKKGAVQRR